MTPTIEKVAPLSFAQQRLWLIDAGAPGSPTYNVPLLMRWLEPVDVDSLRMALNVVVSRHEILRTTYELRGDQPVQVIRPARPVPVEVIDLGGIANVGRVMCADATARARESFDLKAGPPLRCWIWPGIPGGDRVLLLVHHIAIDGWSLAALFEDLAEAYAAARERRAPAFPPLPVQYADFARWDREVFASQRALLDQRVGELLTAGAELTLLGALPAPARAEGERPGRQHLVALPSGLWARLHRMAKSLRVTPFVVLLAAFQQTLWQWSGREDFVIGAFTANRPRPDLERTIGYFVGTVPLRCRVRAGQTFAELCRSTRAEAFGSLTYQRLPYDQLAATAAVSAPDGHRRLRVTVGFALQNMPAPEITAPRWAEPRLLATGTAKLDLLMIIEERSGRGVCVLEHDTERYPAELIDRFAADFLTNLGAGTFDPESRPAAGPPAGMPVPARPPQPRPAPARNGDQAAARDLFTEALSGIRRGPVRLESNFFALGGNSMLAIAMLARARRQHGVPVDPARFLAEPTVATLGRLLRDGLPDTAPDPVADRYPASSAQQRFWTIDRISTLGESYVVPTVLRLDGPVDHAALARAADTVLARHPALRSRFELDRQRLQVFYRTDGPPARASIVDATGWEARAVRDHLAEVCWSGFDLGTGPVARAEILALPDSTVLTLVAHHIVTDGWSQRVLLEQLAEAYQSEVDNRSANLADPVHPAITAEHPDRTAATIEWLRGAPTDIQLPHDRPRPGHPCSRGAVHSVRLSAGDTAALRKIGAEQGCGMFHLTAALLAATLARQGDQQDFLLAFPWSGRQHQDAVGLFVDTLLLRVDLREAASWKELLDRVRDSAAAAYRGAHVPFDKLAAALHPERDLSRPVLTPVFLNTETEAPPPNFGPSVHTRQLALDPLLIKYELELTAVEEPDHLRFDFAYAVELFDHGTIARLGGQLVAAARDLIAHPLGSVS